VAYHHETTKQDPAVTCQSEQKRTGSIQEPSPKGQHLILTNHFHGFSICRIRLGRERRALIEAHSRFRRLIAGVPWEVIECLRMPQFQSFVDVP